MNVLDPTWDGEVTLPNGATARAVRLGHHAGARRLGATLYELDPGAAASPLHFHHRNEELLLVLGGTPTLRAAGGTARTLAAGEVVAFPAGRDGIHQVVNRTDGPVRVLICSTNELPEVRRASWSSSPTRAAGSSRRTRRGSGPSPISSRGDWIRTSDRPAPSRVRYQAAPRPEVREP
jgi:uncharacterized cupin superfamily protein